MVSDNANVEYFSRARKYFYRGYIENPKFWSRLGGEPSFNDLKVLDIGCGPGSLCVDIATKGAKKVVGIDINKRVISFADENLTRFFPHLKKKIDFLCCSIFCVNVCDFDMIMSKDTFEHMHACSEATFRNGKSSPFLSMLYNIPLSNMISPTAAKVTFSLGTVLYQSI